ncbi:MAG: phage tail protein [Burkholderiales bacterium]|nr:phage tail protein [Burkholderiales bacterium]
MDQLTQVKVKHRIFDDAVFLTLPPGASIQEIITLSEIPDEALPNIVVLNHGSIISDWEYVTRDSDSLAICVVPQGGRGGGKSIFGAIAMIAVAAFAWWAAPIVAGAIGVGSSAFAVAAVGAGISMIGGMALNALIKPPMIDIGAMSSYSPLHSGGVSGSLVSQAPSEQAQAVERAAYTFGGQSNQARKYQPEIIVYGKHRLFPAVAATPFVDSIGQTSDITTVYDFGLGNRTLSDMRIGDVPADNYAPELFPHHASTMTQLVAYPGKVSYDTFNYKLLKDQEFVIRTKPNSINAVIEIYFPRGLVFYDDRGNRQQNSVQLELFYRQVGAANWIKVDQSQYYGAHVTNDVVLDHYEERYDVSVGQNVIHEEKFDKGSPRSVWAVNHFYQKPGYPVGRGYVEVAIYWDGRLVWSGDETSAELAAGGTKFGEFSRGATVETNVHYSPDPNLNLIEYLHRINRDYTVPGAVSGGFFWVDIEMNKQKLTQVAAFNKFIYNSFLNLSGVATDPENGYQYLKGDFVETKVISPTDTRHFYKVKVPIMGSVPTTTVKGDTAQPFTLIARIDCNPPGEYEIKLVRRSIASIENRRADDMILTTIRSGQAGNVFNLKHDHTMMEMRLRANDKINGVVDSFSAVVTSHLPVYDGTKWDIIETRNPAWIVYDILCGEGNPSPLKLGQIDLASFMRFAAYCDEQITTNVNGVTTTGVRHTADFVVDYETTVYHLVESVLSMCRATLIMTQSGKYGILIDKEQTIPRQLFTPANSWGFSGGRSYSDRPHCLRVKYVEPNMNWQMNEVLCYDDGKDASNATEFEDLSTFGITDGASAWRYGRYMLAQGLHRSEQFTINVDVENLAVQRGDLVKVAHDVPKIGGVGARVISITGNDVKVTEGVQVTVTNYTVRLSDGTVRSGTITAQPVGTDNVFTFDNVAGINEDDLVVFGATQRVTQDYLVQEIQPGADLTATLVLVRYVPQVYTADQGVIPPWDSGLTDSIINKTDLKVVNLNGTATLIYQNRLPFSKTDLNFDVIGRGYDNSKVYLIRQGYPDLLLGNTREKSFQQMIDTLKETDKLGAMKFQVVPYNNKGLQGQSSTVTVNVLADTTRPIKPEGFSVNVQREIVELFWQPSQEPDIDHYIIRYTPEVVTPLWNASQFLSRVGWQTTHTSAGARTGTYMIRAVDTSGNESLEGHQRTTVMTLPDINFIEIIDDHTSGWKGVNYQTAVRGGALIATGNGNDVVPESYYNYFEMADLGEIYEARISSKIKAHGEHWDDVMSKWVPLSSVPQLSRAQASQWDAWVEVRTSDSQIFMSDWATLSSITPISGGGSVKWSEWRAVQVGDFTGQLFQFRLQLRSYDKNVRPVVTDATIEIDMPDRIDYDQDIDISVAGNTINFDPAFRVVPSLAVTIDGNEHPVVAKVTNKTRTSFYVQLIDTKTSNPVIGKIDWAAKGYGRRRSTSI